MKSAQKMLVVCFALVLLLAACSSGNNGANESPPAANESAGSNGNTPAPAAEEPPMKLTWMQYGWTPSTVTPQQKYIEERFNVDIEIVGGIQSEEQFALKVAAGELPDIFIVSGADYVRYAQQGILMELPQDVLREKIPKYMQSLDNLNPAILKGSLIEGKNYRLNGTWLVGVTTFVPFWNMGMLNEIGYTEVPTHIDQVEEINIKLKEHFPDAYPMAPQAKSFTYQAFNTIAGAYQVLPFHWNLIDGEIVHGQVADRTRELLKRLNSWYNMGLIDPEILTQDHAAHEAKFANRQTAVTENKFYDTAAAIRRGEYDSANQLKDRYGDTLQYALPYEGPYGPGRNFSFGGGATSASIGSHVANDPAKFDKIMDILRASTEEDEAFLAMYYGEEGVTYEIGEDGKPRFIVGPEEEGGSETGRLFTMGLTIDEFMYKYVYDTIMEEETNKIMEHDWETMRLLDPVYVILPSAPEYPDLNAYAQEAFLNFLVGNRNINDDQDWQRHVQEYNDRGGAVLTKEANEWYKNK